MLKTFLTKISKYSTDIKIVDSNFVIPCKNDHILQLPIVLSDDSHKHENKSKRTTLIDCNNCKLFYYDMIYDIDTILPELHIDRTYKYGSKEEISYYSINKSIDYICRSFSNSRSITRDKIYVYDDLYQYRVGCAEYIIDNLTTDNYGTVIQYMKSYFDKLLLPVINNIILEYLLYDLKLLITK